MVRAFHAGLILTCSALSASAERASAAVDDDGVSMMQVDYRLSHQLSHVPTPAPPTPAPTYDLYLTDVWCGFEDRLWDNVNGWLERSLAECEAECNALVLCNYIVWGLDTSANSNRCACFSACTSTSGYGNGTPNAYQKPTPVPTPAPTSPTPASPDLTPARTQAIAQCSHNKWGLNFCDNWCGVVGFWSGCGTNVLVAADLRNLDNVDYECSCDGCPRCSGLAFPCPRPFPEWCTHSGAVYTNTVDCDGDGASDPQCVDGVNTGFVGSSLSCASTYGSPTGRCQDGCQAATCPRDNFCMHEGAAFTDIGDCDFDGVADLQCRDSHGNAGYVGSAAGCSVFWPHSLCTPIGCHTKAPTPAPTSSPTVSPTRSPSGSPTGSPTQAPTPAPTSSPTVSPTRSPSGSPTGPPTQVPTPAPPTPAPACLDTDIGVLDSVSQSCGDGYASYPSFCGMYDDNDFSSNIMCCGCGAGSVQVAVATGDPHVTNVDGARFNIMKVGVHEFLRLPRRANRSRRSTDVEPMLSVLAAVERPGTDECRESYVKQVDVMGSWLNSSGPLRFRADGDSSDGAQAVVLSVNRSRVDAEALGRDSRVRPFLEVIEPRTPRDKDVPAAIQRVPMFAVKLSFAAATLKIDWIHRAVPGGPSLNHLNFHAHGLRSFLEGSGMDIGGILGRDDHSDAASLPDECKPTLEDLRASYQASGGQGGQPGIAAAL